MKIMDVDVIKMVCCATREKLPRKGKKYPGLKIVSVKLKH